MLLSQHQITDRKTLWLFTEGSYFPALNSRQENLATAVESSNNWCPRYFSMELRTVYTKKNNYDNKYNDNNVSIYIEEQCSVAPSLNFSMCSSCVGSLKKGLWLAVSVSIVYQIALKVWTHELERFISIVNVIAIVLGVDGCLLETMQNEVIGITLVICQDAWLEQNL